LVGIRDHFADGFVIKCNFIEAFYFWSFFMNKFFSRLMVAVGLATAGVAAAQVASVKVPTCLQIQGSTKYYIPCTGVVPVDSATGNVIRWQDLFAGIPTGNGTPGTGGGTVTPTITSAAGASNTSAVPVQSVSGAALASEVTLASMFKAGQNVGSVASITAPITIGNTFLSVRLQDSTGAALGTAANPLYVTGGTGGGGTGGTSSPTITANAGTASASAVPVQSVSGAALATDATVNGLFKAGQAVGAVASITAPVTIGASALPTGAALESTQATLFKAGQAVGAVASITAPVTIGTSALPTGAATSAKQDSLLAAVGSPVQAGSTLSNVVQATTTDRGQIVGGSAVQLMAANSARRGFSIQNQSTTASCYINGTAVATADYHSLLVGPGGFYEPDHHVGTGAISVICTAASTPVYSREW
jgi:hypothetical protein